MTVIALPVRKIADQELALLTEIALHPTGRRYPRIPAHVLRYADAGHADETLTLAWTDFKEAVHAREDVAADGDRWLEYFDREDCAGSEHAIELLSQRIDGAYRAIRFGPGDPMTVVEVADVDIAAEFGAGLYTDIPEDVYHRDPVPGGSLSVSGAKKLLPPSCPAIFDHERKAQSASTKAMNFGSAAHRLILGSGPEIVIVDAGSYQTKAARKERDAAFAAGNIPVLPGEYADVRAMAEALRGHPVASALFDPERGGSPEVSLFWQDPETGIWRRCRLDWLPDTSSGRIVVGDYKTIIAADPDAISRSVHKFGYHQQHPWYVDGVSAVFPGADVRFIFVFQEKTPPYLVSVCELDYDAVRVGDQLNRQAIEVYRDCTDAGQWPGYVPADSIQTISLPPWARPRW